MTGGSQHEQAYVPDPLCQQVGDNADERQQAPFTVEVTDFPLVGVGPARWQCIIDLVARLVRLRRCTVDDMEILRVLDKETLQQRCVIQGDFPGREPGC